MAGGRISSTTGSGTNAPAAAAIIDGYLDLVDVLNGQAAGFVTGIAANTANIASNTTAIANNSAAIAALQASGPGGGIAVAVGNPASATAIANRQAIQAALTAGGTVNLPNNGDVYIDQSLIYGSFTRFIRGPQTRLRMIPGGNQSLMKSASEVNFDAGGTTVTLTQTTGNGVNVAHTAHGFISGAYAWISGANQSGYNGTWPIIVVDANNYMYWTNYYQTSAPTGTTIAVAAVTGFALLGGQENYDYPNNSGATPLDSYAIRAIGVADSLFEDVFPQNASKFAFCFNAVNNVYLKRLKWANSHSDGIKIYGPAFNVFEEGCSGYSGDDFISVQTREGTGFTTSQKVYGDIFNVKLKGITGLPQSVGNIVHLYPSDNERFDQVEVDNSAAQFAGIIIGTVSGSGYTVGQMGEITLKDIIGSAAATSATNILLTQAYTIDQLKISSKFNPGSAAGASANCMISSSGTLGSVKKLHLSLRSSGVPASGGMNLCFFAGTYTFNQVVFEDCGCVGSVVSGGITLVTFSGTPTIGSMLFERCYGDANAKYLCNFAAVPTARPVISFRDNRWLGTGFFTSAAGAQGYDFKMSGNVLSGQSLGTFRLANTGTSNLKSDGTNDYVSGSVYVNLTGATTLLTVKGNDIPYDVSIANTGTNAALDQTVSGQYCNSITTGTNKQGPCVKINGNSTATFYRLGDNTQIL